jgi:hypothetical protein
VVKDVKGISSGHEVNSWPEVMRTVEEKFGDDNYHKYLKQ